MAESVKVIVRCRPMNDREKDLKCKVRTPDHNCLTPVVRSVYLFFQTCVFMDPSIMQCSIANVQDANAPPKNFTFDGVYGTDSTTETIYNEITYPLVEVPLLEP